MSDQKRSPQTIAGITPRRSKAAIAFVAALAVAAAPLIAYVIMLAIPQSQVATNLRASDAGKNGNGSAAKMCGLDFSPVSLASPGTPYQGDWACGNHFSPLGRMSAETGVWTGSSNSGRTQHHDPVTMTPQHEPTRGYNFTNQGGKNWDGDDVTPHAGSSGPFTARDVEDHVDPVTGDLIIATAVAEKPNESQCVPTCIFSECVECTWVCYACEIECCDTDEDGNEHCWICCTGIDETVVLDRPDYHNCKCGCGGPYCSQWDWHIWPEPNSTSFGDWGDGLLLAPKNTKRNVSSDRKLSVADNTAYWAFRDYAGQLVQINDQVSARLPHVGMIRPPDNVDPTTWPLATTNPTGTPATRPPGVPWFECGPTDHGGLPATREISGYNPLRTPVTVVYDPREPTPKPTHTPVPTPTPGAVSGVWYPPTKDWEHGGSTGHFNVASSHAAASDQYEGEAGHIFRSLKLIPTYDVIANNGHFDVYMVLKEENIPDAGDPASVEFIFNFHIHDSTCSNDDGTGRYCDGDIIVVNGDVNSAGWGSTGVDSLGNLTRAWYDPQDNEFFNVPGLPGEPGATGIKARIEVRDMRAWYGLIELVAAPPDPFEPTLPTATPSGGSPRISPRQNPSTASGASTGAAANSAVSNPIGPVGLGPTAPGQHIPGGEIPTNTPGPSPTPFPTAPPITGVPIRVTPPIPRAPSPPGPPPQIVDGPRAMLDWGPRNRRGYIRWTEFDNSEVFPFTNVPSEINVTLDRFIRPAYWGSGYAPAPEPTIPNLGNCAPWPAPLPGPDLGLPAGGGPQPDQCTPSAPPPSPTPLPNTAFVYEYQLRWQLPEIVPDEHTNCVNLQHTPTSQGMPNDPQVSNPDDRGREWYVVIVAGGNGGNIIRGADAFPQNFWTTPVNCNTNTSRSQQSATAYAGVSRSRVEHLWGNWYQMSVYVDETAGGSITEHLSMNILRKDPRCEKSFQFRGGFVIGNGNRTGTTLQPLPLVDSGMVSGITGPSDWPWKDPPGPWEYPNEWTPKTFTISPVPDGYGGVAEYGVLWPQFMHPSGPKCWSPMFLDQEKDRDPACDFVGVASGGSSNAEGECRPGIYD